MPISITIGDREFSSKQAAIDHCRAILYRGPLESEIVGDDARFVKALLYQRPDKVQELGDRTIVRFVRKMHRHNTPCFFAELNDGTFLDFSFRRFINAYPQPTRPAA